MRVQFSLYVGHWLRNSVRTQFIWSGCDAFDMRHAVPSGGGPVDWSGACADTVRGSIRGWRAPRRCLRDFKLRIDRLVVLARGVCVVRPRGASAWCVDRAASAVVGCRGVQGAAAYLLRDGGERLPGADFGVGAVGRGRRKVPFVV